MSLVDTGSTRLDRDAIKLAHCWRGEDGTPYARVTLDQRDGAGITFNDPDDAMTVAKAAAEAAKWLAAAIAGEV